MYVIILSYDYEMMIWREEDVKWGNFYTILVVTVEDKCGEKS